MRIALAHGAWLEHDPAWLSRDEARLAFAALCGELAWEQGEIVLCGRRVLQPRLIAWAGDLGYRYSGQTLEPRPFTPTAERLLERVRETVGTLFNHVLVNRYRDGADSMGLHADDEPELGRDPILATVSLGAPRRFVLRPRRQRAPGRRVPICRGTEAPGGAGALGSPPRTRAAVGHGRRPPASLRPRRASRRGGARRAHQPDVSSIAARPLSVRSAAARHLRGK